MVSSGMLRRVTLVRTDVSEELSASFIRVTGISELGTTLAVTSVRRLLVTASVVPSSPILVTLVNEALSSSETSVLTRVTRRNIPEDTIIQPSMLFVAGDLSSQPGFETGVTWDLWWPERHWGRFPPSTSVALPVIHITNRSKIIYHPRLVQ
jgi:hypothetical protein